jgi:hypothetical protein
VVVVEEEPTATVEATFAERSRVTAAPAAWAFWWCARRGASAGGEGRSGEETYWWCERKEREGATRKL